MGSLIPDSGEQGWQGRGVLLGWRASLVARA